MAVDRMIIYGRNIMLGLVVATAVFCLTYSNLTNVVWSNRYSKAIKTFKKEIRSFGTQTKTSCQVPWQNGLISSEEYEEILTQPHPVDGNNALPSPVAVKSLYSDPVIKLRPDFFILPLLQNGPNNQLVGLRETVFMAIKLNRTVAIPKFIKHHTDNRTLPFVSPEHRIQVSEMCTFVSCVTFQQFRKACGYQIDAIIHIRKYKSSHLRNFNKFTGMELKLRPSVKPDEPNVYLIPPDPIPNDGTSRHFRPPDIDQLFSGAYNERCVVYPSPLYNVHVSPLRKYKYKKGDQLVEKFEDMKRLPDSILWLTVSHHTHNPDYVTQLAEEFVQARMQGKRYVSVHWRYQEHEFMNRCYHGSLNNPVKKNICTNALSIKPFDIATSIEKKIEYLKSAMNVDITNIYFATPPSERKVLGEVAMMLHKKHGWLTYSSLDLVKFLDKKFEHCPTLEKHYNDILSTAEMEICAGGISFLGSQRSSWSDVVHISRKTSKYDDVFSENDGDIFLMSLDSLKEKSPVEEISTK